MINSSLQTRLSRYKSEVVADFGLPRPSGYVSGKNNLAAQSGHRIHLSAIPNRLCIHRLVITLIGICIDGSGRHGQERFATYQQKRSGQNKD